LAALVRIAQAQPDKARAALLELLHSDDHEVRALAIGELRSWKEPDVTEALAALAGEDSPIRPAAFAALARQDTPAAAEALGQLAATDDPAQRRLAQAALEQMRTPEAKRRFRWEPAAHDDFNGQASLPWRVLHPRDEHVSFAKVPEALTIRARQGLLAGSPPICENVFLLDHPAPPGRDFQATVKVVGFAADAPHHQAVLLCFADEENFIKLAYQSSPDGDPYFTMFRKVDGSIAERSDLPNPTRDAGVWLRMTKCGDRCFSSVSTDGERFLACGEMPWDDSQPLAIGLAALINDGPERDVSFASFELQAAAGDASLAPAH
jgi:regulation of enolase protein 1 (concanavalin A-like superfamily)